MVSYIDAVLEFGQKSLSMMHLWLQLIQVFELSFHLLHCYLVERSNTFQDFPELLLLLDTWLKKPYKVWDRFLQVVFKKTSVLKHFKIVFISVTVYTHKRCRLFALRHESHGLGPLSTLINCDSVLSSLKKWCFTHMLHIEMCREFKWN